MDKFCIVGRKDGKAKRGAYQVSKRFADSLSDYGVTFKNDTEIRRLDKLFKTYYKVIFTYQATQNYYFDFDIKTVLKNNSVVYTRDLLEAEIYNSASNGFSYYCNAKKHKNFIPLITDFTVDVEAKIEQPTVGFYCRPGVNQDAIDYFKDELSRLKHKINLVVCGSDIVVFPNTKHYYHTYDSVDFFSRITHYYFPQSAEFVDPFPNTLLEAIQSNKQIICPKIPSRKHVDGIDDILQFVYYHTDLKAVFSDKYFDNTSHGLVRKNFERFYNNVLNNGFSNELEYNKYTSFYDWCCHII